MPKKIAVFASGSGSNARKLMAHFDKKNEIGQVVLLVSDKATAGVLAIAEEMGVPSHLTSKADMVETGNLLHTLQEHGIDAILLAGFLRLMPVHIIRAFPNRILNIHPSLLPKFGGKGMYGHFVHEAVCAAGEKCSGMTIHLVNEHYDEGKVIFQAIYPLHPNDSPEDVARKVLSLEHKHYPLVAERWIQTWGK